MLHEFQKGKESFWYPYISRLPEFESGLPWDIPIEIVRQAECEIVRTETKNLQIWANKTYKNLLSVVLKHTPSVFKPNMLTLNIFNKVYGIVITRSFGYGVPYTCLMPFADNFNHSDRDINSYEIINT